MIKPAIPLIGLSTYVKKIQLGDFQYDFSGLTIPYVQAIRLAGGAPVLIPHGAPERELQSLVQRLDGLVLPGGEDVAPQEYGEEQIPACGTIDRHRDLLELALARLAIKNGLPLLAICRGLQVLNVALGGTLWQDLATQVPGSECHACRDLEEKHVLAHQVRIDPNSRLFSIMEADTVDTNSSHHQAIRDLADGLVMTAQSPDGIIEAVEFPEHPFAVGVQWHPERMVQDYPRMLRPFEALVRVAHG